MPDVYQQAYLTLSASAKSSRDGFLNFSREDAQATLPILIDLRIRCRDGSQAITRLSSFGSDDFRDFASKIPQNWD